MTQTAFIHLVVEDHDNLVVVRFRNNDGFGHALALETGQELFVIEEGEQAKIILSFFNIRAISPDGLAVLQRLQERMNERDAMLVMCCLNESTEHFLRTLGFGEYFCITSTMEEAYRV